MRITKPAWVEHANEKNNKCPVYSLSVHPDGTRLATGGLDHKVKIWSTLPIIDAEADDDNNPKLLCTMSTHTGSVLAVRWAHHGRFLASGSDDQVVVIWGIDPEGGGRLWGSDEVNVENWKPLTRLVGHTSDIIDVAWSRDDSMLASVGLDNNIWIWDGQTFERIRKITGHEGFVKGVCWDPVGNFLATQSDDKTVRVWNTENWEMVKKIAEPFKNSPSSTFFRRLSWSPDGAFIAASNAMNGPVFVAAVIDRDEWKSDISFVGHENTIQVAAFNPRLFFRPGLQSDRANASCMVALGANDFSISIWRNVMHKPIVVLKEVFSRNLLDLCWSNDGLHLYGCSEDGTICAISFKPAEFPDLSVPKNTDAVLKEYNYQPKRLVHRAIPPPPPQGFSSNGPSHPSGHVNVLQPRKGKAGEQRRRVNISSGNGAFVPPPPRASMAAPSSIPTHDIFSAAPIQELTSPTAASGARMLQDAPSSSAFMNGYDDQPRGSKRKADSSSLDERGRPSIGRTMGSSRPRVAGDVQEIRAPRMPFSAGGSGSGSGSGQKLPIPSVQTVLRARPSGDPNESIYIEASNATDQAGGVNKVTFSRNGEDQWLVYRPTAILALAMSGRLSAVACEDGALSVYSPSGRELLPTVKLDSPAFELVARGDHLFVVTINAQARVYDIRSKRQKLASSDISHLVDPAIHHIDIRQGVPMVCTSQPAVYAYDSRLGDWVILCSAWVLEHSPLNTHGSRGGRGPGPQGPVHEIEHECLALLQARENSANGNGNGNGFGADVPRAEWWNQSLEMEHLESKMRAAVLLDSKEEYKFWVLRYASLVGKENFRGRAEELVKELIGPVYSHNHAGSGSGSGWSSAVCGLNKRELAKQVLGALAREGPAMAGLTSQYQELLRSITEEEGLF